MYSRIIPLLANTTGLDDELAANTIPNNCQPPIFLANIRIAGGFYIKAAHALGALYQNY